MCHLTPFRSIVRYPELRGDLIHSSAKLAEFLIALSVGYFFYDGFDLLLFGTLQRAWPVLLHHGLVMGSFLYLLYHSYCTPCAVLALLVEVNSVFLHGRQLLLMAGIEKSSAIFRVVRGANLVSFVVLRFGLITYFFAFMFVNRSILYTRVLECMVPLIAAMAVINVILFWRLLKSDVFQSKNGQNQREVLVSN
ncbi:putative TLC domain-containing protein 2-like [Apostichopus japonicus]|uniref:Putative TLC domain-containing protein 2-like n=1 Tax=Stichopus japonicus TaxID=307972 RepID=A0A2G8LM29_STIJA|nr:putative TLC domain-containing protein 2-like [Apostichopus japonicus]